MKHPVRKVGLSVRDDENGNPIIEEVDVVQYAISNQYFFLGVAVSSRDSINNSSTITEIRSAAATAVAFSCIFLEAGINAVIDSTLLGNNDARISETGIHTLRVLSESHNGDIVRKLSPLDKFRILLLSAGGPRYSKGERIYQDAELLFKLRSSIVHPKMYSYLPQDDGVREYRSEEQLIQSLSQRFEIYQADDDHKLNPLTSCLTAGCIEWAISTSVKFWNHFLSSLLQ